MVTVDYLKGRDREDFLLRAAQNQQKDTLQYVTFRLYVSKKKNHSEGGKILP